MRGFGKRSIVTRDFCVIAHEVIEAAEEEAEIPQQRDAIDIILDHAGGGERRCFIIIKTCSNGRVDARQQGLHDLVFVGKMIIEIAGADACGGRDLIGADRGNAMRVEQVQRYLDNAVLVRWCPAQRGIFHAHALLIAFRVNWSLHSKK